MPRTIETISASHQAASSRRAAGRPIWDWQINVREIINEDPGNQSPEHVASISVRIAKLLRLRLPESFFDITHDRCDYDFVDTVEMMETCTVAGLAVDLEELGISAVEVFNGWMDVLYDWADANRIWLGR